MSYILTLVSSPSFSELPILFKDLKKNFPFIQSYCWLHPKQAIDISIKQNDMFQHKTRINTFLSQFPIDYAWQDYQNRQKKLLIADMDSTMIMQECIDELAAEFGIKEQIAAITHAAMSGDIEFEPALKKRVKLLEGLSETVIDRTIMNRITLTPGARTLVHTMKANGAHAALVSGGFTAFTSKIAKQIGFDEAHANTLIVENGKLTGSVQEPILGRQSKVALLKEISFKHKIEIQDTLAIGDGANDLDMLQCSGLGIAFHAKPLVAEKADAHIKYNDLTAVLYFQGYAHDEWVEQE